MNKTVKRALLIAGGVVAACGIIWGGLTLARNAQRGNVDVYAVSDFAMTDYWGDTSQTSGMVSTDKMQKIYLSSTQKVSKIYVEEGQTVKKGDKLLRYHADLAGYRAGGNRLRKAEAGPEECGKGTEPADAGAGSGSGG